MREKHGATTAAGPVVRVDAPCKSKPILFQPHTLQQSRSIRIYPSQSLSNAFTLFTSRFVGAIDSSTDISYQLPWNFGDFLHDIPCRLGANEALDTAADALIATYTRFCCRSGGNTTLDLEILKKHTLALKALRSVLDDPVKACSAETLGAIMLLQIHQVRKVTSL